MSIANHWAHVRARASALLPTRCLACDAPVRGTIDLCAACTADMPVNRSCCLRCATPMPQPTAECGECQQHPPPWRQAWVPFLYAWPLNRLEARFKFNGRLAAGRTLAGLWTASQAPEMLPGAIVPVPLHRARLRSRGYNQALELVRPLAQALDVPLRPRALQRRRSTTAQSDLDARARRANVRGAFVCHGQDLPAHVAVVDDVMTTGATLGECARTLRRAGVAQVDVWALARAPAPHG